MIDDIEFTLNLVRHGESEVNVKPDEMGQDPDVKLTDKGRKQAALLRDKLKANDQKFDFVFSSPYKRAYDTAKIVIETDPIIVSTRLREYDAGGWTGVSRSKTLTDDVKLKMNYLDHFFQPPDGESLSMVERRVAQWLEDCILYNKSMIDASKEKAKNKEYPLNIAVFSHGMTIKCLMHYIMGFDKNLTWKIAIWNTSVTSFHFSKIGWSLIRTNDCSHLDGFKE